MAVVKLQLVAVLSVASAPTAAMLAVFNMIPGYPLDGGRAPRAVVGITDDADCVTRPAAQIGLEGVAFVFILMGLYRFFR